VALKSHTKTENDNFVWATTYCGLWFDSRCRDFWTPALVDWAYRWCRLRLGLVKSRWRI